MITTPLLLEFENLRHKWGWFLLLGIIMLVLGTMAFIIAPAVVEKLRFIHDLVRGAAQSVTSLPGAKAA